MIYIINYIYILYAGVLRKTHRCRWRWLFKRHREVDRRRCKGADVKTQVEINFFNATTILIFVKLILERQVSMDWCPWNATLLREMSIIIHWGQIAMWACAGPALSHEMRLEPQKLWWKCDFAYACWIILRHMRVRRRKSCSSMSGQKCP